VASEPSEYEPPAARGGDADLSTVTEALASSVFCVAHTGLPTQHSMGEAAAVSHTAHSWNGRLGKWVTAGATREKASFGCYSACAVG